MAAKLLTLKQRVRRLILVPGSGGVFEVTANGQSVHSKKATGAFPDEDAVLREVKAK